MKRLYTPWRMAYIKSERPAKVIDPTLPPRCVFCAKVTGEDEAEWVVARSSHVYVTLNLYPYSNGHVMVIPYQHVESMEALSVEALTDLMLTTNRALAALRKIYTPHAFNIGANLGAAAGAGIAAHFHLHIVPRWRGDSNFMSVTGDTRIIPDLLPETWRKLREAWE
jgi:ATP adenylyltransferase